MAREPKFRGTYGISLQPVAGVTAYQEKNVATKSREEVLDELEKGEALDARQDAVTAKLQKKAAAIRNPTCWNVDPETGAISKDEEGGQYTQAEAMMISASIKGKAGQYDAAIALINAAKELVPTNQPAVAERPKEFLVDPETGAITRDPENGEYTLSEARTISYSIQKGKQEPQPVQGQKSFLEKLDEVTKGLVSQRIASMLSGGNSQPQAPADPVDEFFRRVDQVDKVRERFSPSGGGSNAQSLIQSGARSEVVKLLLEDERERLRMQLQHEADVEKNKHLGTLASTVKDNFGDGVRALMMAAQDIQKGGVAAAPKAQAEQASEAQSFQCTKCNNAFGVPATEGWEVVGCPHCGAQYTRQQVLGG